jgi:hypothetical protein
MHAYYYKYRKSFKKYKLKKIIYFFFERSLYLKIFYLILQSQTGSDSNQAVVIPEGDVAQLVEQRTENPCVGGSIPSITTKKP